MQSNFDKIETYQNHWALSSKSDLTILASFVCGSHSQMQTEMQEFIE